MKKTLQCFVRHSFCSGFYDQYYTISNPISGKYLALITLTRDINHHMFIIRVIVGVEWRSNSDGAANNVQQPVKVYRQELSAFVLEAELWPHSASSPKFGSSVAIHTSYGHDTLTAAVGDLGSNSISLYDYDNATETWNLTTIIGNLWF